MLVRGWLLRRARGAGDVGVEPLWLQEAAVLLAADGGCAGAAEVHGAAGATGAADAAVSALLALLGHGEEDEPRWLLEAAAGLVSCDAPQPQLQPQPEPQPEPQPQARAQAQSSWVEQLCSLRLPPADGRKLLRRCGRQAGGRGAVALLQRFARGLLARCVVSQLRAARQRSARLLLQRVSRGLLARCAAREAVVEVAVEAATGGAGASALTAAEWDDRGEHDYISLGCSPMHLSVPLIPRHASGGGGAAVEAATGGAGAGAPAAAEWDDRGEHDYISFGCSPTHLSVPLIPRHAGGVEAAVEAATGGAGAGAPMAAEWDDRGELDYTSLGSSPAQKCVQLRKVHKTLVGHVTLIHAHAHLAVPLNSPRRAGGGDASAALARAREALWAELQGGACGC